MNHESSDKILNESRITDIKIARNHEYQRSNDSASTPERNDSKYRDVAP